MIDSGQFVNGLWIGIFLLALGLVPGLPGKCSKALSRAAAALSHRYPAHVRMHFPMQQAEQPSFQRHPWLAALGLAVIALALFAYVSR